MSPTRFLMILSLLAAPYLMVTPVFGEEHKSETSSAGSVVSAESAEPTVEVAPSSQHEEVQPLDNWVESGPEESSSAPTGSTEEFSATGEVILDEPTPTPTVKVHYPVVGAENSVLKKEQKSRLDKVEKKLRNAVYQEQQQRLKEKSRDPRGETEIRICSVNFNGYGTKEENERLLKKIPKPRIAKAERTILKAIASSQCDVVAVQGLIGRSPPFALEALTAFAKKLSKKTGKVPWKAEVATSKEQNGYQAFLIRDRDDSPIESYRIDSIPNAILKTPGKPLKTTVTSKHDIVPRDFLKLTLEVKSRDSVKPDPFSLQTAPSFKPTNEVVIINGILASGVSPFQAEERLLKLQIADVGVRLFDTEQNRVTPNAQPLILLAVEKVEGILGGVEHILTGRLKLDDFEKDGVCKILEEQIPEHPKEGDEEEAQSEAPKPEKHKPEKKVDFTIDTLVECKSPLDRPQLRFDIFKTVPFDKKPEAAPEEGKKKVKIPVRDLELQTQSIFVVTADLKYTAKKGPNMLDSAAGRVEISNGLPGAYLVWVDLNW